MKRIVSLLLSVVMLMGLSVSAFAVDVLEWTEDDPVKTQVTYVGIDEYYTITVPSEIEVKYKENTDAEVSVSGMWCENCILSIKVPGCIELERSGSLDALEIEIDFGKGQTWNLEGDGGQEIDEVSEKMTIHGTDYLFAEWFGYITYEVSFNNAKH